MGLTDLIAHVVMWTLKSMHVQAGGAPEGLTELIQWGGSYFQELTKTC